MNQHQPVGRGPDFLILGAQKGGTTSLYHYMIQHPRIAAALQYKEIHFFDLHFAKGREWYQTQFPVVPGNEDVLSGEASPYYLFHPLVPQRVSAFFPDIKLIILLRNPAHRAISHYFWEVGLGTETLSLESALAQETKRLEGEGEKILRDPDYCSFNHQHFSYFSRGRYAEQIELWLKFFKPEQFLFIKSEEFFTSRAEISNRVFRFLGLPEFLLGEYKAFNPGNYSRVAPETVSWLTNEYREYNSRLEKLLPLEFGWERDPR